MLLSEDIFVKDRLTCFLQGGGKVAAELKNLTQDWSLLRMLSTPKALPWDGIYWRGIWTPPLAWQYVSMWPRCSPSTLFIFMVRHLFLSTLKLTLAIVVAWLRNGSRGLIQLNASAPPRQVGDPGFPGGKATPRPVSAQPQSLVCCLASHLVILCRDPV